MAKLRKSKTLNSKKIILSCAGGDGTLMSLVKEALDEGCSIEDFTLSILPYGTGNDLSRILGWGPQPKEIWTK